MGVLNKASGGAWTCAAYTEVAPYQIASTTNPGALRGFEFKCGCRIGVHVNVGLKSSSYGSWPTFKSNIARTCTSNSDCGYYLAGVDYGFSCRQGNLYTHYANSEVHTHLGTYDSDTEMRIEFEGDTVTWRVDGVSRMTKTLTHSLPLNVFATMHDANSCTNQLNSAALVVT